MEEINLKLFSPNINKIPKKIPIQEDLEFVKIADIDIPKLKKYIEIFFIKLFPLSINAAKQNGQIIFSQHPA